MSACLVCNKEDFVYEPYGSYFSLTPADSKIQICTTCGFGQVIPLPDKEALNAHYKTDEYRRWLKHGETKYCLDSLPHWRALNRYNLLTSYFDFKDVNRVLDFGAGSAITLRTIKIKHPHISTTAIEISKSIRTLLAKCSEIDTVYEGIPSNLPLQDLIIISETLEHLVNPFAIIRKFRGMLAEKGYLFIEVPHCPFPYYYQYKKFHQPHLSFFTRDSFVRIAEAYGFELLYIDSMGMSIKKWCETKDIHNIVRRTGFSYVSNEYGIFLRVILKKGG